MTRTALTVLHARHRVARWLPAIWMVIVLLTGHVALRLISADAWVHRTWLIGAAAGVALVFLGSRRSVLDTARRLDARYPKMANRFEAIATLEGRNHPLAAAVGAEADAHLAGAAPLPPLRAGWVAAAALAAALGAVALTGPGTEPDLRKESPTVVIPATESAAVPDEQIHETEHVPPPPVAIRWVEPRPAIVAGASAWVPWMVETQSSVPLDPVELRAVVAGGEDPVRQIMPAIATGAATTSGQLDMGTLAAPPFGFVLYHLAVKRLVERGSPQAAPWPEVLSPLQVVQVDSSAATVSLDRPPGDDTAQGPAERMLGEVRRLKLAQIELVRAAFAALHDGTAAEARWTAYAEMAVAQRRVWQTVASLPIDLHNRNDQMSGALARLEQACADAWDAFARAEEVMAFAAASRALSRLGELEALVAAAVELERKQRDLQRMTTADDAARAGPFQLDPRDRTPAGRLEALAAAQTRLAERLARGERDGAFQTQDSLARDLARLAEEPVFPGAVAAAIQDAVGHAGDAAGQLNDGDFVSAVEPAARAALALQSATEAMRIAGNTRAIQEFARLQRWLNETAYDMTDGIAGPPEAALAGWQHALEDQARWQQSTGSSQAAEYAADIARELAAIGQDRAGGEPPATEAGPEDFSKLARRVANAQQSLRSAADRSRTMEQALEDLKRARANVDRAAREGRESLRELVVEAQQHAQNAGESIALTPSPDTERRPTEANSSSNEAEPGQIEQAEKSQGQKSDPASPSGAGGDGEGSTQESDQGTGRPSDTPGGTGAYVPGLTRELQRVIESVAIASRSAPRHHVLTTADPAEAPPEYRAAVAEYFERLARLPSASSEEAAP